MGTSPLELGFKEGQRDGRVLRQGDHVGGDARTKLAMVAGPRPRKSGGQTYGMCFLSAYERENRPETDKCGQNDSEG